MLEDKEQEVRIQFLEEAQEYLIAIETELLGLSNSPLASKNLEAVLRAAHSIKGGAAMMEFPILSRLAHRLEDCFKILNSRKLEMIEEEIELLLLSSIDCLRQIIHQSRQESQIEPSWLAIHVDPIFEQLHDQLGDPEPEDDISMFAQNAESEMRVLLFETEIEEYLQQLELCLSKSDTDDLPEKLLVTAQEIGGLSQMLKLDALTSLCESVLEHIKTTNPEHLEKLANVALSEWRRTQAMVLAGQIEFIPVQIDLDNTPVDNQQLKAPTTESELLASEEEILAEIISEEQELADNFSLLDNSAQDALNWISNLEALTTEEEQSVKVSNSVESDLELATLGSINFAKEQEVADNTIRVSIRHLDRLNELFGEFTVERNSLNLRLKRMRNSLNLLQQKIQLLNQLKILHHREIREAYNSSITAASHQTNRNQLLGKTRETRRPSLHKSSSALNSGKRLSPSLNKSYQNLHPLSQEAIATIAQIQEITSNLNLNLEEAESTANSFVRTSDLMQTKLNQVRMSPFAELVAPFPRALRNLELQYRKKVQLKIKGGSTLIDRTIIEALKDPLMHLVRNAFAHGIEEPAIRQAMGKPEQGTITINAAYRGNQIAIALSDDGKGIDIGKIRSLARQMGLITLDSSTVREQELLQLIFEPGFSTAEEVNDLAGRGVGMDVVRTNLDKIDGTIKVKTSSGLGTTFTIAVPFKLSVIRVLLIESNGMLLAFPSNVVEEMLIVQSEKIVTTMGREFFNLEGLIVPLIRLHDCLNISPLAQKVNLDETPSINQPTVLMIAQGDELFAIQTDCYWREEEVTIRQVEGNLALPSGFCGCTLLSDGRVVPLVDILALMKWIDEHKQVVAHQSKFASSLATENSSPSKLRNLPLKLVANPDVSVTYSSLEDKLQQISPGLSSAKSSVKSSNNTLNTVMVVDDSINTRRFLAITLEKAGYQIEQAKDGQEAIEKLQAGISVYAIICDLEMPRLNGFGFLSQVKSNSQYKHIPVIMLTSRSSTKHRQVAINLGATAYLTKPFQEQELCQTLEKLQLK